MIEKSVIMASLAGIAIMGVVPVIAGFILMASGKLKASSFWAGVLSYIIGFVAFSIIGGIASAVSMIDSVGDMNAVMEKSADPSTGLIVMLSVLMAVCFIAAISICIVFCMKKTRTFKGALSCGLGFGTGYMLTAAFGLFSTYLSFVQINSGEFDKQYIQLVEMGMMDKETVSMMKDVFTAVTVQETLGEIFVTVASAMIFTAAAILIMWGVCTRKTFAGVGISAVLLSLQLCISDLIPNAAAGMIVALAIGAAALIFALRMRGGIVPPEKPSYAADSFMQSVDRAKSEEVSETTSE